MAGRRGLQRDGRRVQFHILTFLGDTWCSGQRPQLPDEKIVAYARQLAEKGSVVTYDVPIEKNGRIPQPFVEQPRAIGRARPAVALPADHDFAARPADRGSMGRGAGDPCRGVWRRRS